MNTPPVQRYNIHGMLWGQRLVRAEQDDGEWVKWDDHATAIADALKRAAASESAMARTLAMDEAEIAAPLQKLLAAMTARAENAEARLNSVYVTIDADHKRMMAMIDTLRTLVDKAIAQRDRAET